MADALAEDDELLGQDLAARKMRLVPTVAGLLNLCTSDDHKAGLVQFAVQKNWPRSTTPFPADINDLSAKDALAFVPLGWSLNKDLSNRRWFIQKSGTKLWKSRAFSFGLVAAVKFVLRFAWRHTLEDSGFQMIDSPFKNLFGYERTDNAAIDAAHMQEIIDKKEWWR